MLLLLAQIAVAPAPPPELRPLRAASPPTIDGRLDEASWAQAPQSEAFTQKYPNEGATPTERTGVRVLYDDRSLYVGITCDQLLEPVIARMTRRDRKIEADRVTVAVDSRGDGTTAFEFSVNAAGVLADTLRFNDTEKAEEWDENWEAKVARTPLGWSVEMRIPLGILRFASRPIQDWGLQVRRYLSMRQEVDEWALIPRSAGGEVSRYGRLVGLERLRARHPVELRPFVLGYVRQRDPGSESLARGVDGAVSAGADLKWHPTPELTLDATMLPDFAQVEADRILLNLTRLELELPEKRPFFLEGRDTFATPLPLVYTRRIGRVSPELPVLRDAAPYGEALVDTPSPASIYGASKLVGGLGHGWSVGTLNVLTGQNDVAVQQANGDRTHRLVEPLTAWSALRVKQEAFGNGHVGALVTATTRAEPTASYPVAPGEPARRLCPSGTVVAGGARCFHDTYVASLDGRFRTDDGTWAANAQLLGSHVQGGPPRTLRDGTVVASGDSDGGGLVSLAKEGGLWVGNVTYDVAGRRLDFNDLGYMPRQNVHHLDTTLEYRTLEPWFRTLETHTKLEVYGRRNFDGLSLGDGYQVNTKWTFDNFWSVFVEAHYRTRKFDDREVGDGTALERAGLLGLELEMATDPRSRVFVELASQTQRLFDGFFFQGEATITVRTLPALDLSLSPEAVFSSGEPRYIAPGATPGEYLFGTLDAKNVGATLRTTYTFTPTLTLQAYAQLFLAGGHYDRFASFAFAPSARRPVITRRDLVPAAAPPVNPDFQEAALNLNVVLRWEYRLGSTLFLVYTRTQAPAVELDAGQVGHLDFGALGRAPAANVFLAKLTYWWSG